MTKRLKSDKLRKFGLDLVGDVPWGTHLCQFYETKEDLIDILVPYFAEGLRNNEFCIWITSPPLEVEEAKVALKKAVPDLDQYIQKGQIEILPYTEWYLLGGEFDADRVLQGWVEKEKDTLSRGLEGLRLTGNTFWIERSLWKSFTDYEAAINSVITSHRILVLCTYSLERCTSSDVIDVVRNHVGTLIRKEETWHLVEDIAQRRAAEKALYASLERYRSFIEATGELGWTTNADGEVVEDIPSFRNFTGQTYEEVKDWGWLKALHPDDLERTTRIWKEATRTRSNYEVEYRVRRYDDVYRYFLARGVPVFKEDGSIREWVGTCIDITDRKKAEEALAESERRYRSLFANMNSGFALCKIVSDNDGKPIDYIFLEVNDDFEKLTGLGKEAVLGKRVSEVLFSVEKDPADWIGIYGRVATTGEPARFESYFELLKKWFSVAAFRPERGYFAMAFDDITDRKKTEELYKQVVQTAIDGFWITDSTGRFLDVNNAYSNIIGYSREELLRMSVHDVETKETPEETAQHIQEIIQHGYGHFETCHRRKDGRIVDVEVSVTSMGQDDGRLFVFVHDITRRKRNEEAVRNLALFPEENPFPILRVAHDGTLLYANHSSARLLELWGCKTGQLVPEQVRQRVALALDAQEIAQLEAACGPVTYSFSVAPIPSLGYANLYGTDITERKQVEEALRESQHDLNRAQAVAKTGSWRLDVHRNELLWSDETYRMFGIPKGTPLTYETFLGTVHPDDKDFVDERWKAVLRGERYDIEHRILVNGEVKWVQERAELEFNQNGLLLGGFGTVQEITEFKEMRDKLEQYAKHLETLVEEKTKQLRDAERLAAIGETAGMVGHDIRNPLQTIICELYLAKGELSSLPDGDFKETLKGTVRAIEDQVTYINKIVTDLQDYAKPLSPFYEETDLEKTLQSALPIIYIPETIEVSSYIADDCPKLMTDPSYVKRILTNLVSNAVQAMPNGGKLAITAHCKDNKVFLNVEDTGEGISEEAKSKLFKPLFTTKAKGQGFGLAVVKKLTDALGGNITFESEPGKGTKFIVELPIEPKTNGKTQKE